MQSTLEGLQLSSSTYVITSKERQKKRSQDDEGMPKEKKKKLQDFNLHLLQISITEQKKVQLMSKNANSGSIRYK